MSKTNPQFGDFRAKGACSSIPCIPKGLSVLSLLIDILQE